MQSVPIVFISFEVKDQMWPSWTCQQQVKQLHYQIANDESQMLIDLISLRIWQSCCPLLNLVFISQRFLFVFLCLRTGNCPSRRHFVFGSSVCTSHCRDRDITEGEIATIFFTFGQTPNWWSVGDCRYTMWRSSISSLYFSLKIVSKWRQHVCHWKLFTQVIHVHIVITSIFQPK